MFDDDRLTPEQRQEGARVLATVFVAFEEYVEALVEHATAKHPEPLTVAISRAQLVAAAHTAVQTAKAQFDSVKERSDG